MLLLGMVYFLEFFLVNKRKLLLNGELSLEKFQVREFKFPEA